MNSTKENEVKKTDEDVQEKQELTDEDVEGVVGGMQDNVIRMIGMTPRLNSLM